MEEVDGTNMGAGRVGRATNVLVKIFARKISRAHGLHVDNPSDNHVRLLATS